MPIYLVNERIPHHEDAAKTLGINDEANEEEDSEEEDEEPVGPKFKVVLENAHPELVKISKKNNCIVELINSSKSLDSSNEHTKMIQYFVLQRNPSWSYKFKQAVMLCPQVNEDDLIVEDVTLFEGLTHFAIIGWNVLFAFIPPIQWGGGWYAFFIALTFIGTITAVVAEVATVLGCTIGLHEAVTAITLVAVGTSLPDTFASMTAAR